MSLQLLLCPIILNSPSHHTRTALPALLASSVSRTPSSPPPDGVHCLAHPGAGHRSTGLCPVAHSAGLPPAPGCSPVSRSWDSRGPQQPVLPPPWRHPPPLQTAVQNRLLLEALPASTRPLPTDCLPWETGRFRKDGPKSPAWHRADSWGTFHEWTKWNPETKTEEEKAECRLPRLCTRHKPAARRGGQDSRLPEKQGECFFLFLPPPDTLPFRTNPEPWSHTSSQMVHWGPRHRPRARTAGNARLREDHVASEGPSREDRRVRLPAGAVGPVPRPSLGVRGGICQSVWCHGRGAVRMFCLSEIFLTHGSPTRSCPHIVTAPRGPLQGVMRRCRDPLAFRLPAAAGSCQVSPGLAAPRRGRAAAHRYHCSPPRAVVNAGVSARHPSGASLSSRAESIQAT